MGGLSALAGILGEAFPPGWDQGRTTAQERLGASIASRTPAERIRIVQDVEDVLGRGLCDMQLSDLIAYELGCHLRPAAMGLTPSDWLRWLAGRVDGAEKRR